MLADVVYSGEAIRSGYRALDQARYQPIDQTPDDLFHPHLFWRSRKLHFRSLPQFREADHAHAGGLRLHQTGAIPVIQIGCVIGDLIAQVDELGFERRASPGRYSSSSGNSPGWKSCECFTIPSRTSNVRLRPGKRA